MPGARVQADDGEDGPEHPQHLVWGLRYGETLGMDRLEPRRVRQAIDPVTCLMIREYLDAIRTDLSRLGVELPEDAYVFSNDPMGATPWNPDWTTHKVSDLAAAAGVKLNVNGLRHYTASQLLAARFDLRNTAARLGHGSGGATTLRHYADPVSEVDRRAAVYLAQLTAGSAAQSS
jgi:integrase